MSKRQNAGKYITMAFYSCQAIQDALGTSPHSATLHYLVPGLTLTSSHPLCRNSFSPTRKESKLVPQHPHGETKYSSQLAAFAMPGSSETSQGLHHCASVLAAAPHPSISRACATRGATRTKTAVTEPEHAWI